MLQHVFQPSSFITCDGMEDRTATAARTSGRHLRDCVVAWTRTPAVNTDRLLMSTSAVHMANGPEGTVFPARVNVETGNVTISVSRI